MRYNINSKSKRLTWHYLSSKVRSKVFYQLCFRISEFYWITSRCMLIFEDPDVKGVNADGSIDLGLPQTYFEAMFSQLDQGQC